MSEGEMGLRSARVTAEGSSPRAWMLVLHGLLGSGANWRTVARRLTDACPSWGMVLVDLPGHGLSPTPPPPHTLEAAAAGLVETEVALGLPVRAVCGHSLGGKVALAYLASRARSGRGPLDEAWLLDASPSASGSSGSSGDTRRVLEMLESLPTELPSRARFIELVIDAGFSEAIADWLAMNVRRGADGLRFRLDLPMVRSLLDDYFASDLWHVVESPSFATRMHVVLGGRSETVSRRDRDRLAALAASSPHLAVHVLPRAGHWLHADDPEGLLELLRRSLAMG